MLQQWARERCEAAVQQYDKQTALFGDTTFCSDYQRCMEAEQAQRELEPLITVYQEYQRLMIDVAEGASLLRTCTEQEQSAAQDFYD